jgi:hypothetical protein
MGSCLGKKNKSAEEETPAKPEVRKIHSVII